jgi:hypothetical protein
MFFRACASSHCAPTEFPKTTEATAGYKHLAPTEFAKTQEGKSSTMRSSPVT